MAKRDNDLNLQSSSLIMRFFIGLFVAFMGIFILGPLIWLALQGFSTTWTFPKLTPDGWTLIWWRRVFETPSILTAIKNSFIIAPIVIILSGLCRARDCTYPHRSYVRSVSSQRSWGRVDYGYLACMPPLWHIGVVLNFFFFAMLPPDMARIAIRVLGQCQKHGASLADEIAKWLLRFSGDHHLTLGSSLRFASKKRVRWWCGGV